MADPVPERNLPAVPSTFRNNPEVWLFLNALRNRVGGTTGDVIYDTETAAQATAAIEGQLLGQLAEVESKITGLVASQIEQIQEQPFDPSGLLTEPYTPPPQEALPPEELLGGFLQAANSTALVQSVFGRTGNVIASEGDYQLGQLGDVTISAPTARQVLTYNGTNWLNVSPPTDYSTGIWSGGTISAAIGSTIFDVSAGVAQFITGGPENPVVTRVPFAPFDAETPTGLTTSLVTYVGVDINGTLIQQTTDFTPAQRRTIATLGLVSHVNLTNITAINFEVQTLRQPLNQLFDLMNAIGPLNVSGNTFAAASTNLTISKSAGIVFQYGTNFPNNALDPHNTTLSAQSPCSIRYRLSNGTQYPITTNIDPNNYESAPGVLSSVSPSDPYTIQHIFIFPSGNVRLQYGQKVFKTMAAAIAGITSENFVIEPILASQAAFRCYLIVKQGTTNLSNANDAMFINTAKFGGGVESAAVGALTAQDIINALGYTPGIGSVTSVAATAPTSGFSISGSPITSSGTLTFTLNDDLAAVESLSTNGIAVRTASSTWTTRSIDQGSNIIITNGNGVSGNPTIALNSTLSGLVSVAATTFTGSLSGNASSATTSTNIAGGISGQIPYQSSANTTAFVTNAAGVLQAITSGATPAWTTTPTLSGTNFTNIPNSALTNSSITIGSTNVALGATATSLSGLTSVNATTFSGSGAGLTSIPNSALTNSSITIGSSSISLGATATSLSGLTSISATTFTGSLSGNASTASIATNISGGVSGSIPYQTAANTTTQLSPGTSSQVLVSGATPTWTNTPTLTGTNFSGIPNSATTATNINTASAIVARDGSGNFSAGTITASLTGAASLNVLKAGDTMTGALGIIAGSNTSPGLFFSGDTNTGIYSPAADTIAFTEGGVEAMRIDSSGNVSIGTSTPASLFNVRGNATAGAGYFIGTGTTSTATVTIDHDNSNGLQNALLIKNLTNWAQSTPLVQITTTNGTDSCAALQITNNGSGNYITMDSNVSIAKSGNITSVGQIRSSGSAGGVGYSTGAGGTVVQSTSKSTGVTLDRPTGQITLNNATLNANTSVSFTLTNSRIASTDVIIVNIASGATADAYVITVTAVATGSCRIQIHNVGGVSLSEALVLNFAVIKGVSA